MLAVPTREADSGEAFDRVAEELTRLELLDQPGQFAPIALAQVPGTAPAAPDQLGGPAALLGRELGHVLARKEQQLAGHDQPRDRQTAQGAYQ